MADLPAGFAPITPQLPEGFQPVPPAPQPGVLGPPVSIDNPFMQTRPSANLLDHAANPAAMGGDDPAQRNLFKGSEGIGETIKGFNEAVLRPASALFDRLVGDAGSNYLDTIKGAWDTLKQDYHASHPGKFSDDFWTQQKQMLNEKLAFPGLVVDALNLVTSPFIGAPLEAGVVKPLALAMHQIIPNISVPELEDGINKSLMALAPEKGDVPKFSPRTLTPDTLPAAQEFGVIEGAPKPVDPVQPAQIALAPEGSELVVNPRAAPASSDLTIQGPSDVVLGGPEKAGNIRLDWKDVSEFGQDVIRQTSEANGGFIPARKGEIPLAHIDLLMEKAGVDPASLTDNQKRGIGRLMRNDDEVRLWHQALVDGTKEIEELSKLPDTEENLIKLQESIMRFHGVQEQVAGLKAEWGRTGKAMQEFHERVSDAKTLGEFLKEKKDMTLDDLRMQKESIRGLNDPENQIGKVLNAKRANTPWDKFMFYWTNALLSGPFTHTAYALSNAAFATYEAAVVTPVAGAIGAAKAALGSEAERVFMGEGASRLYGLVAGMPDALRATVQAVRTGSPALLPREVATFASEGTNAYTGIRPVGGLLGTTLGLPSNIISGIHTLFKFLGYRSEVEALAYRQAAKEGHSPFDSAFWTRKQQLVEFPSEDTMDAGVKAGDRTTFTNPLGAVGRSLQQAINATKVGRLVVPFTRVPMNIIKRAVEGSPAAIIDPGVRADLRGENGAVAKDTQIARMVAGSALGAMAVNWALNDRITGNGPPEGAERELWLRSHSPYSIRIGDHWVSYEKFGPIGPMLGAAADLTLFGQYANKEEYGHAAEAITHMAGHMITSETGLESIAEAVNAMMHPERDGKKWIVNFSGSLVPYSSLGSQVASIQDPYQRQINTVFDAIKSKIPGQRETLLPKRDWSGVPVANPREDAGSVFRSVPISHDPVDLALQALKMTPAAPEKTIGGVQLTPEQYDKYWATAGMYTRPALRALVDGPSWGQTPAFIKEQLFLNTIERTRAQARMSMQFAYPELMQQGIQQKVDRIQGVKE